ncbi:isochorismatase family protein [Ideonella paludis]|uniref:Isochorismatase family protein n=1 Tax=Ideonella paludis TaxID=1233411 RepID=A0ABS5DSK3_9BURK|nr:isochorismatase family protein [Ideonella paludis]MBQ0934122.1 isochorismatase family protein [Ideonella paludis]
MSHPALIVIDLQNDYFPGGAFALANTEATLDQVEAAIAAARAKGVPVVHVQHVADPAAGLSPFFNADTPGVQIHPRVLAAAPEAPVVVKHFADSFERTTLKATLDKLGVDELIVCGMMTQNCVTHTAISKQAEGYAQVTVLGDASTTVSEMLHAIALHALSTRVRVATVAEALG